MWQEDLGGLKAQLLPLARGSAPGKRMQRAIHSAFLCRRRKNATRLQARNPSRIVVS